MAKTLVEIFSETKLGRPSTGGAHPARQLGRVSDADWQLLKRAAKASGQSFSAWARSVLLAEARRG